MTLMNSITGIFNKSFLKRSSNTKIRQYNTFENTILNHYDIKKCLMISPVMISIRFIQALIEQQEYVILESDNSVVDEFIKQQFETVFLKDIINNLLWGLVYGYSACEVLYKYDNDQIVLDGFVPLSTLNYDNNSLVFDDNGDFIGLRSFNFSNDALIPQEKLLLFSNLNENSMPESILLSALKEIDLFKATIESWDLFIRKKSIPTTVVNTTTNNEADLDTLYKVIQSELNTKGGAVILDDETTINTIQDNTGGSKSSEFDLIKNTVRNDIFELFGIYQLMANSNRYTDSYAKSKTNKDISFKVINNHIIQLNHIFNNLVKLLVNWNFSDITNYPVFKLQTIKEVDYDLLFKIYNDSVYPIEEEEYYKLLDELNKDLLK